MEKNNYFLKTDLISIDTSTNTSIGIDKFGKLTDTKDDICNHLFFYIILESEISKSDWVLNDDCTICKSLGYNKKGRKIIATTNPALNLPLIDKHMIIKYYHNINYTFYSITPNYINSNNLIKTLFTLKDNVYIPTINENQSVYFKYIKNIWNQSEVRLNVLNAVHDIISELELLKNNEDKKSMLSSSITRWVNQNI